MFSIRGRLEAIKFSLKASNDENTTNYLKGMFETLVDLHANYGLDVLHPIPSNEIFLNKFERQEFSQFNEDGILDKIFETIGMTDKIYMTEGPDETFLERKHRFSKAPDDSPTRSLDLLSVGEDWYNLRKLLERYSPRVIVAKYNGSFLPPEDKIVSPDGVPDLESDYHGASFEAFYKLGRYMGYNIVSAESTGYTIFMVREDIPCPFYGLNDTMLLYRTPKMGHRPCGEDGESHSPECLQTYRLDGIHGYKKSENGTAKWTSADAQLAI
jgi:hypothetical protein